MAHPVDTHVGKRLRLRRQMLGMTQQQIGDAVGIKFQQIQKYEQGTNRVSASRLYDIARAMSVDIAFFFSELEAADSPVDAPLVGAYQQGAIAPDRFADKEAQTLIRCFFGIPEQSRKHLLDLARSVSKVMPDSPEETKPAKSA